MKNRFRHSPVSTLLLLWVIAGTFLVINAAAAFVKTPAPTSQAQQKGKPIAGRLQPNSLCSLDEQVIFSCAVKRTAKLISLCASANLTKDAGYLQYRFGRPGGVELEFPKDRQGSRQKFHYTHYFRFQVDLTEITFSIDDYQYLVFDDYNAEEKPAINTQGVTVTAPGKTPDVTFPCRSKPKADYSALADVLGNENQ